MLERELYICEHKTRPGAEKQKRVGAVLPDMVHKDVLIILQKL